MLLLLWLFMASLLFSSLVILLLMPSKYKLLSNCPAPRGILDDKHTHVVKTWNSTNKENSKAYSIYRVN